jgi:hypothetical protein
VTGATFGPAGAGYVMAMRRRRPWSVFLRLPRSGVGGAREWWAYFGAYGDDMFDDEADEWSLASQSACTPGVVLMNSR